MRRLPQPPQSSPDTLSRRAFVAYCGAGGSLASKGAGRFRPIVVRVRAMFDRGAHSGAGLEKGERSAFESHQQMACRHYATSGIFFDLHFVEGAYLRTQGYSEIPEKFLARKSINLFVTDTLRYDIDRDRTGGSSMGPRPPGPKFGGAPFYMTFLGLREAAETTLEHEYAHHFAMDTTRRPTAAGNFWADLRNDYWLWRQRRGFPILPFRACADSEWAEVAGTGPRAFTMGDPVPIHRNTRWARRGF